MKGKGKGIEFLRANINYAGEDCLPWPFFRDPWLGRGRVGYLGKMWS